MTALLLAGTGCASSAPPRLVIPRGAPSSADVAYRVRHTLELVRGKDGGYRLSGTTEKLRRVLTRRAARSHRSWVGDPFFARVGRLRAWKDDRVLEGKAIEHVAPRRRNTFLSESKVYRIDYGAPRVGQELGLRYTRRYRGLAFAPVFYVPNINYVASFELQVKHPEDVKVDFRLSHTFSGGPKAQVRRVRLAADESGGRRTLTTLRFENLREVHRIPHFPLDRILVAIWPSFRRGDKSLLPDSVDGFARWYRGLTAGIPGAKAEELALVRRLVRGAKGAEEKLARIYAFARKEVRYEADERGMNAWVPRPAMRIADQRYGDCKDKAFLIKRLAAAVGIDVDLVLVSVRERPTFPGVHIGMFDHMIAAWRPRGRAPIFLDATCRLCEFGNWPNMDTGKQALIFSSKGTEKVRLPSPRRRPSLEVFIEGKRSDFAHAEARLVLRNELRWAVLRDLERLRGAELRTRLSARVGHRLQGVLLSKLRRAKKKAAKDKGEARELTILGQADLSQFVVSAKARLFVPRTVIKAVPPRVMDRAGDRHPIVLDRAEGVRLTLRLRAPGYVAASYGSWTRGDPALALAETEVRAIKEGGVEVRYAFEAKRKRFGSKLRQRYLSFCRRYRDAAKEMIELRQGD